MAPQRLNCRRVSDETVTTEAVCEAAGGIHLTTAHRWANWGLLPKPTKVFLGRRGTVAQWPKVAVEQARWVRARLDGGLTKEQVRESLEHGDFKPVDKTGR